MPGEIVNLRQARKAKEKAAREARARENRAKFGRPKHERLRVLAERKRDARGLDGARSSRVGREPLSAP